MPYKLLVAKSFFNQTINHKLISELISMTFHTSLTADLLRHFVVMSKYASDVIFEGVRKPKRRWLAVLTLPLLLLGACSGGTGSGNCESTVGTDLCGNLINLTIPIFYVKRSIPTEDILFNEPYAFNPGAALFFRSAASSNAVEINITDSEFPGQLYDVKDLALSTDGTHLLFAMHPPEIDPENPVNTWSIWDYDISKNTLRRVFSDNNFNDEGHDIAPAYLNPEFLPPSDPDAPYEVAFAFSSTRQSFNQKLLLDELKEVYVALEEDSARNSRALDNGAIQAVNIHVYDESLISDPDKDELRQISFNQSHDTNPVVLPSGNILYTRWDNIANHNQISLYRTSPYGHNTELIYGYHSFSVSGTNNTEAILSQIQPQADGQLFGLLRQRDLAPEVLGGALVKVDIANYVDRDQTTFDNIGLLSPAISLISGTSVFTDNQLSLGGRFSSASLLNDNSGRILATWSPCLVIDNGNNIPCQRNESLPPALPQFGIWIYDPSNPSEVLLQPVIPAEANLMYTEVLIAEQQSAPNIVNDSTLDISDVDNNQRAILAIDSIYDLDGVGEDFSGNPVDLATQSDPAIVHPSLNQAKFLRLVKAVSIPDEVTHAFNNSAYGVDPENLMREIVGYLPIDPDGSVRGLVPANVALSISVVDASGKRISARHGNWLHLAPNETFQCVGCHEGNNNPPHAPHGRIDAQPLSINPGAPGLVGIFPNTEQGSGEVGQTMAESFARFILPDQTPEPDERRPTANIDYADVWTDESGVLMKAPATSLNYENLTTANPENPFCKFDRNGNEVDWTALCRIVINYEDHIQPLWEEDRTPVDGGTGTGTCIACHTSNNGMSIPAAQLDLTSTPPLDVNDQFTSYRELLRGDEELADNNGVITIRSWECMRLDGMGMVELDGMGNPILDMITPTIGASLSEAGANFGASPSFFSCFDQDNNCASNFGEILPANCVETGGDPLLPDPAINPVNHNGLLSAEELRLIAEWLDIGAQYFNNPFKAPSP